MIIFTYISSTTIIFTYETNKKSLYFGCFDSEIGSHRNITIFVMHMSLMNVYTGMYFLELFLSYKKTNSSSWNDLVKIRYLFSLE